jgi:hypothetical protein
LDLILLRALEAMGSQHAPKAGTRALAKETDEP